MGRVDVFATYKLTQEQRDELTDIIPLDRRVKFTSVTNVHRYGSDMLICPSFVEGGLITDCLPHINVDRYAERCVEAGLSVHLVLHRPRSLPITRSMKLPEILDSLTVAYVPSGREIRRCIIDWCDLSIKGPTIISTPLPFEEIVSFIDPGFQRYKPNMVVYPGNRLTIYTDMKIPPK